MRHRVSVFPAVLLLCAVQLVAYGTVLAEESRPADLTVFFSSDTRGMLRRCGCAEGQQGGVSARASYIKRTMVPGRTLVLDAGDSLFDGLLVPDDARDFYMMKARTLLTAMGQAGYDAAAIGEYDLAYGWDFLTGAAKAAGFPLLAANVSPRRSGKPPSPLKPGIIKRVNGVNIGIVGVLDSGFPFTSFPKSFGSVRVTDPVRAARKEIKRMRGKAGIIIVLAHYSVEPVEGLVKALPEADIVIQGHSQELLEEPVRIGGTLLVKGFNKGKHIGRLDLWLAGGKRITGSKYSVAALDESIPADPVVEKTIAGYRQGLKEKAFVWDRPDPEGSGSFAGPGRCKVCHMAQYRNWSGTAHARSYPTLVKTGDQYDPECLPCHTTGYGFVSGYKVKGGMPGLGCVSCESCHGRGSAHARSGTAGNYPKEVPEDACRTCHDEWNSPNFEYERYKELGGAHKPVRKSSY